MIKKSGTRKNIKNLTIKEQTEIINYKYIHKMTDNDISEKFSVDRSTISKIIARKDKILNIEKNVSPNSNIKKICTNSIPKIECILLKWIDYYLKFRIPITDNVIKVKAQQIYDKLKETETDLPQHFNFSNGWLSKFKLRNNIIQKTLHGESGSINEIVIKTEIEKLNLLLIKYGRDNIFNSDESPLFYKLNPNRTLAYKSENINGLKKCKERITILLACNASGTIKLKPFIIGKYASPRCLKNKDLNKLEIQYMHSKNAWITKTIWEKYVKYIDSQCTKESILLIDNCSAHLLDYDNLELKYLTVYFFPPNTTGSLQPCDAGIIKTFKTYYKSSYIEKLIFEIERGKCNYKITLYEALLFSSLAWGKINQNIIVNCWNHTKIIDQNLVNKKDVLNNINDVTKIHENEEIIILDNKLKKLASLNIVADMTAEEYISIENKQLVDDKITDNDIINDMIADSLIASTINDETIISSDILLKNSGSYENFKKYFYKSIMNDPEKMCSLFYTFVQENKNGKKSLENIEQIILKNKMLNTS
jgi:transcription initiation factor IIE alpha subunit